MSSRYIVPLGGLLTAVSTLPAYAALDVTAATDYLSGDVTTALTAVGGAVILLAALSMGFKWIKAMFFG